LPVQVERVIVVIRSLNKGIRDRYIGDQNPAQYFVVDLLQSSKIHVSQRVCVRIRLDLTTTISAAGRNVFIPRSIIRRLGNGRQRQL